MSLTTGRGPLSPHPAGRFEPPLPGEVTYIEPFLRRIRGKDRVRTVIDTERAFLVHRSGAPPTYAFPASDVHDVACEPEPAVPGYVRVAWHSVPRWYEEEEEVFGHPRNPYHRVDCVASHRRLRVEVGGEVLVDTTDVIALFETSLAPKLYVRRDLVRMDLLVAGATTTYCPYKGTAWYWTAVVGDTVVDDVAWSYHEPLPESSPIAGYLSFDPARADVRADVLTAD
ncbi:DUF427 domain-containing protein [Aquihabitans sp. McL0605]|uniref:DUF427 domain-containing protein n=1 Tax=Aquihabitans sp. McL0605 TaxID=3415671 RepID=UPI003CE7BFE7